VTVEMFPTTVERCIPILKYLKYTSILPVRIIYSVEHPQLVTEAGRKENVFKEVEMETSKVKYTARVLVLSYNILKLISVFIQLGRIWILRKSSEAVILTALYFPVVLFLVVGTCLKFLYEVKKVKIIGFLNQWHRFEEGINRKYLRDKKIVCTVDGPSHIFRGMRNGRSLLILLSTILVTFATTNPGSRRHAFFLYSIVDDDLEIPWLLAMSVLDGTLTSHSIWPAYSALDLFVEGFPRSAFNYLKLISNASGNERNKSPADSIFTMTGRAEPDHHQSAMRMYAEVENLVEEFNSIFSEVLFWMKVVAVCALCGSCYACLKPDYDFNIYSVAMYLLYAAASLGRQIRMLGAMGKVYHQSAKLKRAWLDKASNPVQIFRLQHLPLMQFQIGGYYGVTPNTILTLFSVTTTYVIVLLQL